MKKIVFVIFILFVPLLFTSLATAYEFPLDNEYAATIIGTPLEYKAQLPEDIKIRNMKLTVFENREIPEVLWYEEGLRYSLVYQKEEAPLVWIIAGTGAGYNAPKMQMLQKAFYQAGFHVVSLSSPTHPNFIVSASSSMIPGHLIYDSKDLYNVMELIWEEIKGRIDVSEFYLTGYSLGAAQAAFVSKLDEEMRSFNFSKVYMINPPFNLFNSVNILDAMLEDNIQGGPDNFNAFWEELTSRFADIYTESDFIEFNNEFLYETYRRKHPQDSKMAAVIGLSFRISSMNMLFATDVMTKAGYIIPEDISLSSYDPLTDYFKVYARTNFTDYFDDIFYGYYSSKQPGLTREALIDSMGLESIEGYLKNANKISVVHNEDDLILAPGEIDFFRRVFGSRAKIYPDGGHCGNMDHKDNVAHMLNFFTAKEVK